jgi:hypothetical protein
MLTLFKNKEVSIIMINVIYIEEWRLIRNRHVKENMYLISNFGKVKNFYTGEFIKPELINSGYLLVNLISSDINHKYSKCLVHRLVAEEFVPNNNPYKNTINHINGNKLDNSFYNLEWVTQSENNYHAKQLGLNNNYGVNFYNAKLSYDQVVTICEMLSKNYKYKDILIKIGLDPSNKNNFDIIGNIKRRITYTDISSKYIFPKRSYSNIYTNDQIHEMCKMIENNVPVNEACLKITGVPFISSIKNKQFYEFYRMLKNHKICKEIAAEYDF